MLPHQRIRKPKDARYGTMLTVRVSREQYDLIEAAADRAEKTLNGFCSDVLIAAANEIMERKNASV